MAKFAVGAITRTVNGNVYTQSDVFCHEYYSAWRYLIYDPVNGTFYNRRVKRNVGSVCKHNGYVKLWVGSKKYNAHRIAWVMTYGRMPPDCIDHINRVRSDNRICNLRSATVAQNIANSRVRSDNALGIKGVYYYKNKKLWNAQICVNQKHISLGYFKTLEEAVKVREEAALKYFGEFSIDSSHAEHELRAATVDEPRVYKKLA